MQKDNKLTEAQQSYFKDSKMTDEKGQLQTFYHATNSNFDTFDKDYIGGEHGASFGEGFYFSSEPIPSYGDNLAVYLNVQKPYVLDLKSEKSVTDFARKMKIKSKELQDWIKWYSGNVKSGISKALKENDARDLQNLKDKGYDGLIILNTSVGMYGQPKQDIGKEILVFEPEQIKSIDNLYPTKNPNFKDNSQDYINENPKLSLQERFEIAKHIKTKSEQVHGKECGREIDNKER